MISILDLFETTVQIARCVTKNGRPSLELDCWSIQQIMGREAHKMIMVVCISGAYRSGKSFFLSLLLHYLANSDSDDWIDKPMDKLFHYSNSSERVTAGIWIWSEPFILKNRNGRDVAIFLMDSQGWHDNQTTLWENGVLFSFATIMSSVMIFNVEKNIRETDIESLQRFVYNAKLIDDKFIHEPFQKLIVLIRDWISSEYSHGYYSHSKTQVSDFVQDKLKPKYRDQSEDSRKMRQLIQHAYNEVDACLMPYPGEIVGHYRFDSALVSRRFSIQINQFCRKLFHPANLVAKRYNGEYLTCAELFQQVIKWKSNIMTISEQVSRNYKTDIERIFERSYQDCLNSIDQEFKDHLDNSTTKSEIILLMEEINKQKTRQFTKFELNSKLDYLDKIKKDEMNIKLKRELNTKAQEYNKILQVKLDRLKARENVNNLQDSLGQVSTRLDNQLRISKSETAKLTKQIGRNDSRQREIDRENRREFERFQKEQAEKDKKHEEEMLWAAAWSTPRYQSSSSDCTIL